MSQKPTPTTPTASQARIFYYAKPAFLQNAFSVDWKSLGITDLLINPGYMAYLSSRKLNVDEITAQLTNAVKIANSTPLTISLNSTGQLDDGTSKTFKSWDDAEWSIILDNLKIITQIGQQLKVVGYFIDTELYGAKMPQQVVGQAWPPAPRGVVEKRASDWVNTIIQGHPGSTIGMHGFHSWEDQFPSYKRWCDSFGTTISRNAAKGFFFNEDGFTNNFEHFATTDKLKNLQSFYHVPVWPMFQAPTAGTQETNEAFWKRFTDNSNKLFKKVGGCSFYQDDDIFSLHPLQGGIMTRALKSIRG